MFVTIDLVDYSVISRLYKAQVKIKRAFPNPKIIVVVSDIRAFDCFLSSPEVQRNLLWEKRESQLNKRGPQFDKELAKDFNLSCAPKIMGFPVMSKEEFSYLYSYEICVNTACSTISVVGLDYNNYILPQSSSFLAVIEGFN